jgi:D-glycero-alpha-D-manno-heptose-7-phosphate kinase
MIIRSKAPLRLGFAGGGTDVSPYCELYGGNVLNATIDMYAYCTIEVELTNGIVLHAADRKEHIEFPLSSHLTIDGVLNLHKGVYNHIVKHFNNDKPIACKITTYSDAPAGSGLGSSSTMVVAIIAAFVELLNLPLGEYDIAALAFQIERQDLGLSGGRQDQYAATFGGINFMEFYENNRVIVNPLRIKDTIVNELENSIVLYYTGTSRDSAKIINEQINNTKKGNNASIEAMHAVKLDSLHLKEHLLKGNISAFAETLNHAWISKKKMAKAISNNSLEKIYDFAVEHGAYAGKISGAGGGGFMMFMVDPVMRIRLLEALQTLEGSVVNIHFTEHGAQAWRVGHL